MKAKTVHVDFVDSTFGTIAHEGEHNRTQLVFALDEDLQACDFINAEFGIEDSGEKLVLENLLPQEGENTLSVSLTQDVTVSGVLTIQLVGYVVDSETAEPRIIAKSPVVSGVVTPSINGIEKIAQGVAGFLDRILVKLNDLAKKAHIHTNKDILDEITENPAPILEDLIVGGRNLIKDGALDKQGRWVNGGLTVDFNQGYMVLNKEATSGRVSYYQTKKQNDMLAASENAQTYTATIEVMKLPGVAVPDNSSVEIHFGDSSRRLAMPVPLELSDSSWTILTATTPKDFDVFGDMTARIIVGQGEGGFSCRNFRLESFTPALESVNEKVDKMSGAGLTKEQEANLNANTEARHTHSNKSVIDKLTEDADGKLKFGDAEIGSGGIQSLTAFPEIAKEGDVVLLHRCNEISVDDSNSGIILDIPAIVSLGVPEGYYRRQWDVAATNPKGVGLEIAIEIQPVDDYILTGLMVVSETFAGRWYWKNDEFTTDIYGGEAEPPQFTYIPLGYVDSFTFTKTLYDLDYWDTPDTDETVIFRTVPREYMYIGGEWELAERTDEAEGSIIASVEEKEKDGQLFLRLNLADSRSFKGKKTNKALDIPIAGSKDFSETVGGITLNGSELDLGIPKEATGGIQPVTALPETANEGDVVYYCPPPNRLTAADSGHKVYFDSKWVNECPVLESGNLNRYTLDFAGKSAGSFKFDKDESKASALLNDMKGWKSFRNEFAPVDGVYIFSSAESYGVVADSTGRTYAPSQIETATLPEFDTFEIAKEEAPGYVYFYALPRFYRYTNGGWVELPYSEPELPDEVDCELTDTTLTYGILPNIFYRFGEVDMLNLDLLLPEADKIDEYKFSFISGETATVLTLPDNVVWAGGKALEAVPNALYTVTVLNGVASFETTAKDDIWQAIDEIRGGIDEIETLIDESGVLE